MSKAIEYLNLLKEGIAVIPTAGVLFESLYLRAIPLSPSLQRSAFFLSILLCLFGIFVVVNRYYNESESQTVNRMHWWAAFWMVLGFIVFLSYYYMLTYFQDSPPTNTHAGIILDVALITGYSLFFGFISIAFSILGMEFHLKRTLK